ncbi:hypothetical protein PIB30_108174, partial [Stylosanthes scabra]|nr:hypothetical protein [Stylosanthes scabra]
QPTPRITPPNPRICVPATHMRGTLPPTIKHRTSSLQPIPPLTHLTLLSSTITDHPRICVHPYAYAWNFPPLTHFTFLNPTITYHPRICVGLPLSILPRSQLLSHTTTPAHFLLPTLPCICVPPYAYAWEPYLHIPTIPLHIRAIHA